MRHQEFYYTSSFWMLENLCHISFHLKGQPGVRLVGSRAPRVAKSPTAAPSGEEDSEAWRQQRKKQDLSEAVDRPRRRREE